MARPLRNPRVANRIIDDAAVLISPSDSLMYWLNPVATRTWQLADGTRTMQDIALAICGEFDTDLMTALRDVEEMTDVFVDKGLILLDFDGDKGIPRQAGL